MIYLLPLLAICILLASLSQWHTAQYTIKGMPYNRFTDWAYFLVVVILVLFAGLRVSYNDTVNYMRAYLKAPTFQEFVADPDSWNPFTNPLFNLYRSILKSFTNDPQLLIFTTASFTQICFIRFSF